MRIEISDKNKCFTFFSDVECDSAFMYEEEQYKYDHRKQGRVKTDPIKCHIWKDKPHPKEYVFDIGWLPIVSNHFGLHKFPEVFAPIWEYYTAPDDLTVDLTDLWGNLAEDIGQFLRFKYGLIQGYTGSGKSEAIATITKMFLEHDRKVVIISNNNNGCLEIQHRINKKYGILSPINRLVADKLMIVNPLSLSRMSPPVDYKLLFDDTYVVLVDEADRCCSDTHFAFYSFMKNLKRWYGFSATIDDASRSLTMEHGIRLSHKQSKKVVNFFGGALVSRPPDKFKVNLIRIKTAEVNLNTSPKLQELTHYASVHHQLPEWCDMKNIVNVLEEELWKKVGVVRLFEDLAVEYKNLVVPINKKKIIDFWIENLRPETKALTVTSSGFLSWQDKKWKSENLTFVKENIKSFDLIFGTESLYRSLDFPELQSSLLISGRKASGVIQPTGRVTRQTEFNIIQLLAKTPIISYTSSVYAREALIEETYKLCKINKITLDESRYRRD